jgi:hypothetical protein
MDMNINGGIHGRNSGRWELEKRGWEEKMIEVRCMHI